MDQNYSRVSEEKKLLDKFDFDTVSNQGIKYVLSKEVRNKLRIYIESEKYISSLVHKFKQEHDIYDVVNRKNYSVKYEEALLFFKKKCRNKIIAYHENEQKGIITKPVSLSQPNTLSTTNASILDILKVEPSLRFLLTNEVKRSSTPIPTILSNIINRYLKDKLAEVELY